jgi:antirestriction protein
MSAMAELDTVRDDLESEGYNVAAMLAWCELTGEDFSYDNRHDFDDAYAGEWDSFREYADELAGEVIIAEGLSDESLAERHFDWDGFARDLMLSGENYTAPTPDGGVWVFRSY